MTQIKDLKSKLLAGEQILEHRNIKIYVHKMPNIGGEDRGWQFTWIGGRGDNLEIILQAVDTLLDTGYQPGDYLPCKNCGKDLYLKVYPDLLGFPELHHVDGDYYHCQEIDILPGVPEARCHICNVAQPPHGLVCSAAGMPRYFPKAAI